MTAIKVLLADDHPIVREGLRAYLSTQRSLSVVGEAVDGGARREPHGRAHELERRGVGLRREDVVVGGEVVVLVQRRDEGEGGAARFAFAGLKRAEHRRFKVGDHALAGQVRIARSQRRCGRWRGRCASIRAKFRGWGRRSKPSWNSSASDATCWSCSCRR